MDYNVTYREKDKGIQAIISYKDNNGKWKQKSKQGFKTQKVAKPWIDKTVDDLKDKIGYINPEYEKTTFAEVYNAYIKHIGLYTEQNTLTVYNNAKQHFDKICNIEVNKITLLQFQECVDDMIKLKLGVSSIITYTSRIKSVFRYAVKNHMIKDNPATDVSLPKEKTDGKEKIKALTKEELDYLLSKIKNRKYYLVSLIAATCGLRIGEILGLTWDNIYKNNSTLKVCRQWKIVGNEPYTKSGKEIMKAIYNFGPVKSKNSNRIVPIPPNTMAEIEKYKQSRKTIDISNRLFPYKAIPSCANHLNKLYRKIGYDITIHDLRHTYASMLVANGLDFKSIAELMGHTVNETIKTYSHFTKDMMIKATNLVNSIF